MRTEKLRGLWVASLTPLAADGRIDTGLFASHCRWLFGRGVDGVAVFGTTGEGQSFSVRERLEAVDGLLRAGIPGDRIVVGTEDEWAKGVMTEVYRPLFLNKSPILFTSRRSSELIKYAANAFLAVKITFINEMADLCEKVGADVQDVARGIGMDNRIGSKFLHAGPGYGGSCFPKDTLALLKTAEDYEAPTRIVEAVVKVNDSRKRAMGRKVIEALGGMDAARGKKVAMLGLTFKPNTDDMRDSPSIAIAMALADAGVQVSAYDPEGMELARPLMPEVTMCTNAYAAIEGADATVIVTEWDAFRALDLDRIKQIAKAPVLVDLRNVYDPAEVRAKGFAYSSVGRV